MYDVIVVGGGPAGISAALVLGRCQRNVLVIDAGLSRNRWSNAMHGFISRDGMHPLEFLKIAREELKPYGVQWLHGRVGQAICHGTHFEIVDEEGNHYSAKKLMVATGISDYLPELEDIETYYGKSIHHCPYCDGWESRNKPLVAYGIGKVAVGLSMSLKTWSPDVTLCTDGTNKIPKQDLAKLTRNGVKVKTEKITKLRGDGPYLKFLAFEDKSVIPCEAMFFSMGTYQNTDILQQLNCELNIKGIAKADVKQKTNVPGLYVAGDTTRDMQQVIIASAEGTKAGIMINIELQKESYL
jgi:thioredoxin reductase